MLAPTNTFVGLGYAGSSLETEPDSNDVMEIKKEADGNDVTECSHDDKQNTGMFGF